MIPENHIIAWQHQAPWQDYGQVEQDLVISRMLVEIFSDPFLSQKLIFRGGTALYKLYFEAPIRYSEDLDFVMREKGPIGEIFDAVREKIDPIFETKPVRRTKEKSALLRYRFTSEFPPRTFRPIKIEINYSEIDPVLEPLKKHYSVNNPWFNSTGRITVYQLDELIATKLRALFQRKKGRDLFDLQLAITTGKAKPKRVIECFNRYTNHPNSPITRARFEKNLTEKYYDPIFRADINPLLGAGRTFDFKAAMEIVHDSLISGLAGDPYAGDDNIF